MLLSKRFEIGKSEKLFFPEHPKIKDLKKFKDLIELSPERSKVLWDAQRLEDLEDGFEFISLDLNYANYKFYKFWYAIRI